MAPSANTRRHSYDPRNDNHVINTFVCPVVRDFVTAMMRVSHRLWPVAAIAGGGWKSAECRSCICAHVAMLLPVKRSLIADRV